MVSHLLDVSLRVLPLALAAAALLRIPRMRSAAWSHAVWTTVLLSMLTLFALGPALKPIPLRILPAPRVSLVPDGAALPNLTMQIVRETSVPLSPIAPPSKPASRVVTATPIATMLYASVAVILLARLLLGSWLARRLLRGSVRTTEGFYESPRIAVPLTIGVLRPVILLPSSWRSWDRPKLNAVVLHESSHIRRRDSLIAFLARLNGCLFWFHPLAWWMEHRLAFLAEQACDEACVCMLENRREYACLLLDMADAVEASGGRISGHALAMARPSQVRRRIEAILDETRTAHRGLTATSWIAVLLCGIPIVFAAGSMRIDSKLSLPRPMLSGALVLEPPSNSPLAPLPPILLAQAAAPTSPAPPQPAASGPVFLPVSVLDPGGRYVTGLRAGDFEITGHPITAFQTAEGRHAVVLLKTMGVSQDAVDAFQRTLDPRDESFTAEGPSASNMEGFWDAIATAVTDVKQKQNPVKAVVVMMQGGQIHQMAPEQSLARVVRLTARAPRVAVWFVNVEDVAEGFTFPRNYSQDDDLRIIAGASGGMVIPVARPEEMPTALKRLALDLRYQYLLGIEPPNGRPDALDRLRIAVTGAGMPPLQAIGPQAAYLHE